MPLGKLDKKKLQEHKNGWDYDQEKDGKNDKEFDVGMACCDKDDMLGRTHPNKKLK